MTRRQALAWAFLPMLVALNATPLDAQYFGRNKVQYESFDFEVLETDHFDIYYYPEEEPVLEYVALMAERWYARLSRILDHDLTNRQPLIIYANPAHFRQTNTLQGDIGEATGGVTEILKRRIVLPLAGPLAESDHVLGHELVHAFQFDITGEGGGIAMAGIPAAMAYPLWFVEGMAEYLSVGPNDPHTAMWMRDAARSELPNIQKLSDPRFFPYRYGQALWAYVAGRWGDDVVGRLLKASKTSGNASVAFARRLISGKSRSQLKPETQRKSSYDMTSYTLSGDVTVTVLFQKGSKAMSTTSPLSMERLSMKIGIIGTSERTWNLRITPVSKMYLFVRRPVR